jgi:transposase-like protein
MNNKNRPELAKSEVVKRLPKACSEEAAAVEFFEEQRWGNAPSCPHCQSKDVYKMLDRDGTRNKRYLWRCRGCAEQYTVRIGSIFEDSRLPLKHWAYAFWRACSSKKGVSALEIHRHCEISYKTALFLLHRIRFAVTDDHGSSPKLDGTCEVDETYCGGVPRRIGGKAVPGTGYRMDSNKVPVLAMVQRGGQLRTKVVPSVTARNLGQFIDANVDRGAIVNTDGAYMYRKILAPWARHDVVNHQTGEYYRYNQDGTESGVNCAESFFSLLKRGLNGIFHAVSKEHLHRYCGEFEFRWNTRRLNDGERITAAIKKAQGKHLTYEQSVCRHEVKQASQTKEAGQERPQA